MPKVTLVIRQVHGPEIRLQGERSERDLMNFGSNVERGMDAPYLAFVVDGVMTLVPKHNVASVDISPAPSDVLIKYLIRDVQRAG